MIRFLICLLFCQAARAASTWYVSPTGSPFGTGSSGSPWDFQTAQNKIGVVLPGDLVWMRNGIYTHLPQGAIPGSQEGYIFRTTISGTVNNQITFRSYPGELARVDGEAYGGAAYGFHANARPVVTVGNSATPSWGNYITFQDIEFFSSSTEARLSGDDSSFPASITRTDGPNVFGTGVKFINCIIHDLSSGMASWRQSQLFEFYGNVVYNNGWRGTPNKHGHNFYTQHSVNASGLATIKRNISVGPYDWGIQAYGSSNTEISRYRISENIFVGDQISHGGILLGTRNGGLANRLVDNQVLNNFGYGADLAFTFNQDNNAYNDLVGANNYFYKVIWELSSWKTGTFTNNWLIDRTRPKILDINPNTPVVTLIPWNMNRNTYVIASNTAPVFGINFEAPRNWAQFTNRTGFELNSTMSTNLPSGTNYVVVQNNVYDTNRAHVAAYNWTLADFAAINVSTLNWGIGSTVMVRNAQNYFVDVSTNQITSTNTLVVDMRAVSHSVAIPYGDTVASAPMTFPDFGAFVLQRMGTGTNVPPPPPPPPPPATVVLTVQSSNPSSALFVQMAPADKNGASNGSTPFTRSVLTNTVTRLTAPLRANSGTTFQKWQRNGVDFENNLSATFTNNAATTMVAIYLSLGPVPSVTIDQSSYRRGARQ